MANAKGQGRKPKASTIVEKQRESLPPPEHRRLPPAPGHLNDIAKAEWRRTGRMLLDTGLFATLDTTALATYCVAYARWVDAERKLEEYGAVIKAPSGFLVQSPYLAISNKAMEQMMRVLQEFGMTPASRVRIPRTVIHDAKPQRRHVNAPRQYADPRDALEVLEGGRG